MRSHSWFPSDLTRRIGRSTRYMDVQCGSEPNSCIWALAFALVERAGEGISVKICKCKGVLARCEDPLALS